MCGGGGAGRGAHEYLCECVCGGGEANNPTPVPPSPPPPLNAHTHPPTHPCCSPAQWDLVNTIRCSGETLLTLITDILDFSRIEADKMVSEGACAGV